MAIFIPSISTCASRMTSGAWRAQCVNALRQRKRTGEYNPTADAIQIMTMKVSKGLEFPVVALPGVGHMPATSRRRRGCFMWRRRGLRRG